VGQPGDRTGQLAVLRAVLLALGEMDIPGSVVHLPFDWPEEPKQARTHLTEPPPIAQYLRRHSWDFVRLLSRNPPQ
jgi:hypothetical protein